VSSTPLPRAASQGLLEQLLYFNEPQVAVARLRERFGPLAPLNFLGKDHVFVLTAEGARDVFAGDPAGYDAFFKQGFTGVSGPASLWVLTGAAHRRERQLFAPAVHANHFRKHGSTVLDITRLYLEKWQPGQTIRAMDTTLSISRDVIMRLVFGVEEGALMDEGREILDELRRALNPMIVFIPQLQKRWFPPWRRFARAKDHFTDWVNRVLLARRARGGETDDVVGSMLAARYEDGSPMRDDEIRDELITILQGGHETTAAVLAWALYELGRHPDVLAKLRAELESIGAEADPGLVIKLPYLGAVCDETVRLHPILSECARVLTAPQEILGHTIPAGNALVVSIVGIHHDPELYPEPNRFNPERFIERPYSRAEFLPFGGAHRRCLGAALSEYETRIALAEMVLHWDFESAAPERDARHDVAMGPKHGVRLRIKGRRDAAITG
jgi:cytochrome P450 family 110